MRTYFPSLKMTSKEDLQIAFEEKIKHTVALQREETRECED